MATFGVTPDGLVIKRQSDIQKELNDDARGVYGTAVDLDQRRPLGQFLGIFSERLAQIWELAEQIYLARYPRTAEGKQFDDVASYNGLQRRAATYSKVGVRLTGTIGTVIPAGTRASVQGSPDSIFATDAAYTCVAGLNEIQEVLFDVEPVGGAFTLIFDGQATTAINWNASAAAIKAALEALSNLSSVNVIGDFYAGFVITFTSGDGQQPQPLIVLGSNTLSSDGIAVGDVDVTIQRVQAGEEPGVDGSMTATTTGPIPAPAGTLVVREDTVSGWTGVTNPLDAVEGLNEETDAEFKARRVAQIARGALCTPDAIRARMLEVPNVLSCVVYFNNEDTTVDGIPPKSVRVVLLGGESQAIAVQLFASVAAGIKTIGGESATITDDSGFPQTLRWDEAEEVEIWVELDLETNDDFPMNGEDELKASIVAFGDTLGLGDDVIVYPYFMCTLDVVKGITSATIRIGKTSNPSTDANIAIDPDQIARFDTSRIEINILS